MLMRFFYVQFLFEESPVKNYYYTFTNLGIVTKFYSIVIIS
jgi:hypothetical protein